MSIKIISLSFGLEIFVALWRWNICCRQVSSSSRFYSGCSTSIITMWPISTWRSWPLQFTWCLYPSFSCSQYFLQLFHFYNIFWLSALQFNIFKHIQTFSDIFKHIQTYSGCHHHNETQPAWERNVARRQLENHQTHRLWPLKEDYARHWGRIEDYEE